MSFICLDMPYFAVGNTNGFCSIPGHVHLYHYSDVIMSAMASQVTSLTIVYSTVYSGADPRKQQSSVSLALVRGIQLWPVNSLHNGPVTWKMLPFDDVIMMYFVAGGRMAIMAHRSRPVLPPLYIFWEKFLVYTCLTQALGLYSLSGRTSYRKISWSIEVARFGFRLFNRSEI